MFEIYQIMKRRAVTMSEWTAVGKLLLYPVTVIVIYIFGILNFVLEMYDPTENALLFAFIISKNFLHGRKTLTKVFRDS